MSEPVETESLEQRLRRALPAAMKARDRAEVEVLRTTLAAIANAEAVAAPDAPTDGGVIAGARIGLGSGEAARRDLSDADVAAIVQAEIDERLAAAGEYAANGRDDEAERLRTEAGALQAHLA